MRRFNALRKYILLAITVMAFSVNAAVIPIASLEDLRAISESKAGFPLDGDYELAADIDAAPTRQKAFAPIGTYDKPFTGKLNGKGFVVRSLYIDRPSAGHTGLFGYVGKTGRISNLGVIDADISGSFAVGALAGTNTGSISYCYSSGLVNGLRQESNAGGLAGVNGGLIEKSYSAASVSGKDQIGGLAGFLTVITEGRVAECYATGSVSGSKAVGGLVGYVFGGSIVKSFSMGAVSAKSGAGGLVGVEFRSANPRYDVIGQANSGTTVKAAEIVNCFWDIDASGVSASSGGGDGKTTQEMRQSSTYEDAGWDLKSADSWKMPEGQPFPQIKSPEIPEYTIVYKASPNGKLSVYGAGGTQTEYRLTLSAALAAPMVTAMPDAGHHFVSWSDGKTNAARVDVSNGNAEFTALFANNAAPLDYYTLSYEVSGNGRLLVNDDLSGAKSAYAVALVDGARGPKITAAQNPGSRFAQWSDGKKDVSRSDLAEGHRSFVAQFVYENDTTPGALRRYTLAYEAVGSGKLMVNDGPARPVKYDTTLTEGQNGPVITAVPESGYRFVKWSDNAGEAARRDAANKNVDVFATFAAISADSGGDGPGTSKTYKLAYEAVGSGRLTVNDASTRYAKYDTTLAEGQNGPRITAVPESGYRFVNWSDGITEATRRDAANKNLDVFASFTQINSGGGGDGGGGGGGGGGATTKYTLTYETTGNGKLLINNATEKAEHTETVTAGYAGPTVTAVPDDGYRFSRWSDNSAEITRKDIPTQNITYYAIFARITGPGDPNSPYSVKYLTDGNGKLKITLKDNPPITVTVLEELVLNGNNTTYEVTAIPNSSEYEFSRWSDGFPFETRKDIVVTRDTVLTANFSQIKMYTLTYNVQNPAGINVGGLRVDDKNEITPYVKQVKGGDVGPLVEAVFIEPQTAGYKFTGWSDGKTEQRRSDTPTDSSQKSFTAIFVKWDYINIPDYLVLRRIGQDNAYPLNGKYELNTDIDAAPSKNNSTLPFAPIGNSTTKFTGEFRGNGYAVKDLYFNNTNMDNVGLFGYTDGAEITGVRLDAAEITGKYNVGGLVGNANNTLIDNCGAGGTVKGDSAVGGLVGFYNSGGASSLKALTNSYSKANVHSNNLTNGMGGGLAGWVQNALVKNCSSTGAVTASGGLTGGLIGYANSNGSTLTIEQCHSTGNVTSTGTFGFVGGLLGHIIPSANNDVISLRECYSIGNVSSNGVYTGGLLGNVYSNHSSTILNIERCYATGTVSASSTSVGGFAGGVERNGGYGLNNRLNISHCYATGNINAGNYDNVGGIVGSFISGANNVHFLSMSQCYSIGTVNGTGTNVNGFIGTASYAPAITNCYYNNETSVKTDTKATGQSTADMKKAETYVGWGIGVGGIWAIDASKNGGYPYLVSLAESLSKSRPFMLNSAQSYAAPSAQVRGKSLVITAAPDVKLDVRFFDLRGRVIWRQAAHGGGRISLARVPPGRYIMELREGRRRLQVSRVSVR